MSGKIGGYRWTICALIFFGTTINYVDRQVLSLLNPTLSKQFGWTKSDFGDINAAFQVFYALGMVTVGRLFDRIGTKKGFSFAITFWSLAAIGHAFAGGVGSFKVARSFLGFGESGNFPGAIKSVAEWFPKKERALAAGIFNAGTNVGAMITPFLVAFIVTRWSWQVAFLFTGALGFIWLVLWLLFYDNPERHKRVSAAELAYIQADGIETETPIPWLRILPYRQAWAFMVGKFLTDAVWWFYLTWIPTFLSDKFHLDIKTFGPPVLVIYVLADVGSIGGGWLSSALIRAGRSVNFGRKTAMLICAVCVLPALLITQTKDLWTVVFIVGFAAAAHQGFSCNLYTLTSDTFPKKAVASVVGLGGMTGAIGGALFQLFVGRYVDQSHGSYLVPFAYAATAYLVALGLIQLLTPKLTPAVIS